jgi:formiminotetrahydrofolate cyclodeaminase
MSSIDAFLTAAAGKQPAPGGGSVTALVGALAASMGEMVLNYSVGRKDSAAHDAQRRAALAELARARAILLELMVEDQDAFEALLSARKAGAGDPRFAAALLACIRIPQSIGATALAILQLASQVAPIANKYLLSDLAVCAELAMATLRCAAYNVRINLSDIVDAAERSRFDKSNEAMVADGTQVIRDVIPAIWKRINEGK